MSDTKTPEVPIILETAKWGKWFQPYLGMPTEGKLSEQGLASGRLPDTDNFYHVEYNQMDLPENMASSTGGKRSRLSVIIDGPKKPGLEVFARISSMPEIVYKGLPSIKGQEMTFEDWANRSKVPNKNRYQLGQKNPFTEPSLELDKVQVMIVDLAHPPVDKV